MSIMRAIVIVRRLEARKGQWLTLGLEKIDNLHYYFSIKIGNHSNTRGEQFGKLFALEAVFPLMSQNIHISQ